MKKISIPDLKAKALKLLAESVKLRAFNEGKLFCYTCDAPLKLNTSNCQLGHYLSRGAYPSLTFHPDNSRPQCYACNCHKHGNLIEFRTRLICEIGIERVEALEAKRFDAVKWDRSDLHGLIDKYSQEIKELKS